MNIAIFYFSPTGNTNKIVNTIEDEIKLIPYSIKLKSIDITPYSNRKIDYKLNSYDSIIFGFPVYGWHVPKPVKDWLLTLEGNDKRAAIFFTYGGVNPGIAHFDTIKILHQRNFHIVATAEFVSSHTYNIGGWELMEERPDKTDFDVAKAFIRKVLDEFTQEELNEIKFDPPPFSEKTLEKIKSNPKIFVKSPHINKEICNMCLICQEICPTKAINAEFGNIDGDKCIRCLSCVKNCPENAIKIDDLTPLYQIIKRVEKLTEDKLSHTKSKFFF